MTVDPQDQASAYAVHPDDDRPREVRIMAQSSDAPVQPGHYVSANGLRIYYEDHGQGGPLVLVHGGTASSQMWHGQIPAFATHFRVLAPDSRGHGRTVNPSDTLSYRGMADDLAAFVQALGLHKPLIYGYSDGGQIALELGMRYPDLAQALVVGAAWFKFTEAYQAWVESFLAGSPTAAVDTAKLEQEHPDYVAVLRTADQPDSGSDAWRALLLQSKAMWLTPLNYTAADFQQIAVPTLILSGDRDQLVPVEEATEMYRLIPAAELAIVPNVDHLAAAGSELVQSVVLDFLLRHRQRADQRDQP